MSCSVSLSGPWLDDSAHVTDGKKCDLTASALSFEKDDMVLDGMRDRAAALGLPPLRVCVMSATLDVHTFQNFFPGSTMIKIPGRQYPVQIVHSDQEYEVSFDCESRVYDSDAEVTQAAKQYFS